MLSHSAMSEYLIDARQLCGKAVWLMMHSLNEADAFNV